MSPSHCSGLKLQIGLFKRVDLKILSLRMLPDSLTNSPEVFWVTKSSSRLSWTSLSATLIRCSGSGSPSFVFHGFYHLSFCGCTWQAEHLNSVSRSWSRKLALQWRLPEGFRSSSEHKGDKWPCRTWSGFGARVQQAHHTWWRPVILQFLLQVVSEINIGVSFLTAKSQHWQHHDCFQTIVR